MADRLGQAAGDLLVRAVASRLTATTRDTDTVARYGGDEFVLIQSGISRDSDAAAFAKRLIAAVSAPYDLGNQCITVDASVGIAVAPRHGTDSDLLLRKAAAAVNRCKSGGQQGEFSFFD